MSKSHLILGFGESFVHKYMYTLKFLSVSHHLGSKE